MARLSGVDLRKWYGQREVVRGVSPEVNQGEIVGLLGPNGAGKTTSFYMLTGIIKPSSGRVLLEAQDIGTWPLHERARVGISYLPQEHLKEEGNRRYPSGQEQPSIFMPHMQGLCHMLRDVARTGMLFSSVLFL